MVEENRKNPSIRLAVAALLPATALLFGSSSALATGLISHKGSLTDAIGGTGRTEAIGGTGRTEAIGGTGRTEAIGGTGRKTAIDAIGGTGRTAAIGGTGRTEAIGGTGRKTTIDAIGGTGRTEAIGGTGRTESTILLAGQVEAVDLRASTVTVLGQSVRTAAAGKISLGDNIAMVGRLDAAGNLVVAQVRPVADAYVAGASRVTITGKITGVDAARAVLTIGRQQVDFSALLASGTLDLAAGSVVTMSGIQPVSGGIILAIH